MSHKLSRRQALGGLAAGVAGPGALIGQARAAIIPVAAGDQPPGVCVLLPQADEGPYYFDPALVRVDIAEDRPGLGLDLKLHVIEAGSCTPIANARVDVWHADAGGVYSGYARQGDNRDTSTKGQTYLRGTQLSDAGGRVAFRSIYPGWYPGRTPHIHVKVFLEDKTLATGQIYFPDDVSARIYGGSAPYSARPAPDRTNATDGIFQRGAEEGGGTVLAVQEAAGRMAASLVIAVDLSGQAASAGEDWGDYLRRLMGWR